MSLRDLEHIQAIYDGEIRWTDEHIGTLLNALQRLDLDRRSIMVMVGDHGDEFLEHDGFGHRRTLYNEVIHVPLILRTPGLSAAREIDNVVSVVDIMPTILGIIGIENPAPCDGQNLLALPAGSGESREVYSELHQDLSALITQQFKLIYDARSNSFELYDIRHDPVETTDLRPTQVDLAGEFEQRLGRWLKAKKSKVPVAPRAQRDRETLKQLKSLGYIQ
jgi:arylsulfatase A-like enzyme